MKKLLLILLLASSIQANTWKSDWRQEKIEGTVLSIQNLIQYYCTIEDKIVIHVWMEYESDPGEYIYLMEKMEKHYTKENAREILKDIRSGRGIFVFERRDMAFRFFQMFNEAHIFVGGFKVEAYDQKSFVKSNTY